MRAVIYPGIPRGVIDIPSSKSLAHRALICASLARGTSHIGNIALSDDIEATLRLCRAAGFEPSGLLYGDYLTRVKLLSQGRGVAVTTWLGAAVNCISFKP